MPRVGSLHRDHREIGARLDGDIERSSGCAYPLEILVARARVDDHAEPLVVHVVDDQVVDHAAGLAQHARVERLARLGELGDVVREQPPQELADAIAAEVDDAHVRDVEHAGVAPHRVVLLDLRAVDDRHVPAAEVDHAGAGGDMRLVERCAQGHQVDPEGTKKRGGGPRDPPPLCPVT